MDMYQKRKMRAKNNNSEEKSTNVGINWYIPTLINFPRKPYFARVYI